MRYRHNWQNTASAQDCVEYTVADAQAAGEDKYGHPVYGHWWKTTVPFENWTILLKIIVNNGNATGTVNSKGIRAWGCHHRRSHFGKYVTETWHGKSGTCIVPWWINVGEYQSANNF